MQLEGSRTLEISQPDTEAHALSPSGIILDSVPIILGASSRGGALPQESLSNGVLVVR